MTAQSIPLTAWEQAAVVVLFGLFFLAVLGFVYKIVQAIRPIITDTNKAFQDFIDARDAQWREFFSGLHESDEKQTDKISDVLDKLVVLVQAHDTKTDAAIATMKERTASRRRAAGG